MNQALRTIEADVSQPLTAVQIRAQVNLLQEVMQSVMKADTHFGTIPGCKQPSLYKAGAEKIMATFRLAAEPMVDDLSNHDCVRYRVTVRMVSPTGIVVGFGVGECSSNEEKYKWRKAICTEEFKDTPEDRRRIKYQRGGYVNGSYNKNAVIKMEQVRTEPADIANTVLKMAKKRALIDGVLTTTSASDIFTQDIEDLPDELKDEMQSHPEAKKEGQGLEPYPKDQFEKNLHSWADLIISGKRTPADIINMVGTKYMLSNEQKTAIKALANKQEGDEQDATKKETTKQEGGNE